MDDNTRFLMEWFDKKLCEVRDELKADIISLKDEMKPNTDFRMKVIGGLMVVSGITSAVVTFLLKH